MSQIEAARTVGGGPAQPPAGWLRDPSGLYQLRYWNGAEWTEHVAGPSGQSRDPLHASSPVRARPAVAPGSTTARPAVTQTAGDEAPTRARDLPRAKLLAAGVAGGIVVVASVVWGWTHYNTADRWRDRAEILEHNLATADDAQARVEERASQMNSENSALAEEREGLVRVVDYADDVNLQMADCLVSMDALVVASTSGSGDLNQLYDTAAGECQAAVAVAEQLQREIAGLGL